MLAKGYDKQSIHKVLHTVITEMVREEKEDRKQNTEHRSEKGEERKRLTGKKKLHSIYRVLHRIKNFLFKHITSKGLLLLKTQFAKKPKNPV